MGLSVHDLHAYSQLGIWIINYPQSCNVHDNSTMCWCILHASVVSCCIALRAYECMVDTSKSRGTTLGYGLTWAFHICFSILRAINQIPEEIPVGECGSLGYQTPTLNDFK